MEAKFKIGDKVKILPRNGHLIKYRSGYTDGMTKYVGQIATICKCFCIGENSTFYDDDGYCYKLDVDTQTWNWNSSMLAPLNESKKLRKEFVDKILLQRFKNNKKIYKLNWKV